jgi:3-methylcrotonyl-CoA carboxylase alpha subunit
LVEWQLRVASGERLPLPQHELRMTGHAIEARICAENPDNNFLPATGTLRVYAKPGHSAFESSPLRFDDGVRQGDAISPYYDSMIAKLIVHGSTRAEALARLDAALAQTHIVGLNTNVQFLRHVVHSDSFAQARLDTALIQREEAVLFRQERLGLPMTVAAAVASTLAAEAALAGNDPFSRRDAWSSHGIRTRRFAFEFKGEPASAVLQTLHDGAMHLTAGNASGLLTWALDGADASRLMVRFQDRRERLAIYRDGEDVHVFGASGASRIAVIDILAHAGEAHEEGGRLTAPMPGKVVTFSVKAGDKVRAGQSLAVMEAMKMEHTIAAPADGTVLELLYAPGDQVAEGAELLKLGA